MINGNIFQVVNQLKNARNPRAVFMHMVQKNPKYRQVFDQLQNSSNGASAEDMARQLAKRQGISDEQLAQMYNSLAGR